jgi:hypothetical protein
MEVGSRKAFFRTPQVVISRALSSPPRTRNASPNPLFTLITVSKAIPIYISADSSVSNWGCVGLSAGVLSGCQESRATVNKQLHHHHLHRTQLSSAPAQLSFDRAEPEKPRDPRPRQRRGVTCASYQCTGLSTGLEEHDASVFARTRIRLFFLVKRKEEEERSVSSASTDPLSAAEEGGCPDHQQHEARLRGPGGVYAELRSSPVRIKQERACEHRRWARASTRGCTVRPFARSIDE